MILSLNVTFNLETMTRLVLSAVFALMLLTVKALPTTNDCDLCVSIAKSPASFSMCWTDHCRNITTDIVRFQYFHDDYLTPEEVCAELNYCVELDLDPAPVIISPGDQVRWLDLLIK
jgi:hypothetical protein